MRLVTLSAPAANSEYPLAEAAPDVRLLKPFKHSALASALRGDSHAVSEPAAGPAGAPTRVLRILLVEDHPVNQMFAARLLEKRGHQVAVAANGREAVAAVARDHYDLILMDVQMPEMDGFEATAAIRNGEEPGTHIPIVAMTAHTMKGDRERCLAAGMDSYISKPVRPEELDRAIAAVVAQEVPSPAPD
jgi:CheY-like chemotaxis protein